jgi:hypothetical protein
MTPKPISHLQSLGADADLLRAMIQYLAQRMMEMDAEGLCAAAYAIAPARGDEIAIATKTT